MSYDIDPFDTLVDAAIDGARICPRFQIFCGVTSAWRVCETDYCGRFEVAVYAADALADALSTARVLNQAEALTYA
jgi:hypothetical protein